MFILKLVTAVILIGAMVPPVPVLAETTYIPQEIIAEEPEEPLSIEDLIPEQAISVIVEEENVVPPRDLQWEAFLSATWRLETGNGTSSLWTNGHNAGGIKCGQSYCHYETEEEGMQALERLLRIYVDQFGYDFKAIRARYCQCGPEDYPKFMEIYYEEYGKGE